MIRRFIRALRSYFGFHVLRVFMVPLEGAPRIRPAQSGLRYAALTEPELLDGCRDPALELDEAKVLTALRRGDICIGALDRGRLVGYVWFAFGDTPHVEGSWVHLQESARYLYKAFIRPDYRRRGIAPQMYASASALCPRRGRRLGVLAVDADNAAGLRTPRRAGWRAIGYAGFVRCLGRILAFRSYGPRSYGFAFFAPRESRRNATSVPAIAVAPQSMLVAATLPVASISQIHETSARPRTSGSCSHNERIASAPKECGLLYTARQASGEVFAVIH
jgi:ribosomal protein S18 acetylase RimI-like enzyme